MLPGGRVSLTIPCRDWRRVRAGTPPSGTFRGAALSGPLVGDGLWLSFRLLRRRSASRRRVPPEALDKGHDPPIGGSSTTPIALPIHDTDVSYAHEVEECIPQTAYF